MPTSWTPPIALCLAAGLAACGDSPVGPAPTPPLRSVLTHDANSGANLVWNTDRTSAGALLAGVAGLVPIGAHAAGRIVALLDGTVIALVSLDRPTELDTIIAPAPSSHTLASFSNAGDQVAIAAYAPVPALLVYDRVNRRVDTLPLGGADPVLPPVFAPDGQRLVLFSLNDLSMLATIVPRSGVSPSTVRLRFSRVLNRPVFGWPHWIGSGIRMAFRRLAEDAGPDTLVVGTVFPDDSDEPMEEAYRTLLVPADDSTVALEFGDASTYALTADGTAVVLGLVPVGGRSQHAIYHAGPGIARPRPIVDNAGQFPVFPLFIRE